MANSPVGAMPSEGGGSASQSGRVNSLDGVRTFAVLAVMMVHAGFPGSELGWLGVDVFFVLSGFLITTLLCSESRRKGNINLPKFWGRRFLRLMPAYWLYVGTLSVWMYTHPNELSGQSGWSPRLYVGALWGYFINYLPMGGIWKHQHLTIHLWSLAVEEQFYFLWPFICFFAFRLRRPWIIAWGVFAAVLVRRLFAANDQMGALLTTRGVGIVLGCAVAMTLAYGYRPRWLQSTRLRNAAIVFAFVAISVLTVLHRRGLLSEDEIKSWAVTWLSVVFACTIAMLWYGPADRVTAFLATRPMAYLGQISYGLYLYHSAARLIVWDLLLPGLDSWNQYLKYGLRFTAYLGLTILIATVSYQLVERPFLILKSRLR